MSGYLSGSTSLSVTDTCWSTANNNQYYGDKATASATVSVSAGSNTASYSITVTTTDYNYIQIYLKVGSTVVKNEKDSGGKKTYSYSGTVDISGGSIAVKLGVGCSQYTESAMSFTDGTLSRTYWSDVGKGTVTITDNGNNTFKISGTKGANGTNNTAGGPTLQYSWNNSSWTNTSNNANISFTSTAATRTVYARSITTATYGSNAIATANKSLTYYIAPGNPGTPVISYTKSRLTIKEPWTFSWTAASAGNTSSPVAGYRLRLYKNNTLIPIKDSEGNTLSSSGSNDYWYDTDNTNCSCTIDPIIHGYAPGDTVKLAIFAYIKTGNNEKWWSGQGSTPASSIEYTIQNAGVMRPLVNNQHVEGVVWACIPDSTSATRSKWVEADIVKTCISTGNWVEAE